MKSLLISSQYFPPYVGGISHMMAGIATTLGPDRVCCLTGTAANGDSGKEVQIRVYRRPNAFAKSNYQQAVGWGMTITEIMLRERPRMVQLASTAEGYLGLWLQRWCRLPFVMYAYGNEILEVLGVQEWAKPRLALQQADRVIAISRYTADLVQQVGVPPDRIDIVHPGCDVAQFQPRQPRAELRHRLLGDRAGGKVILTVGGLVARKGHDMVIRALAQVCQAVPDVTYLITGDGPHRAQLEALAVSLGVRERVIFAGRISDAELPDIYALSDVFIMPSREQRALNDVEGFGLVFLEANACGKPVIGGRSGGIPDAVADGVSGFLVDPHDPADIARGLIRLLSDRDLARRLGQQGLERVRRDFDWSRIAGQVQGILESI